MACSAPAANATTILDLIGAPSLFKFDDPSNSLPSQVFTDFSEYNCTLLESFTMNSTELRITEVSVLFRAQSGFMSFYDIQGYYLNFFSNPIPTTPTSIDGDVASVYVPKNSGTGSGSGSGSGAANVSTTQVSNPDDPTSEYGLVRLHVDVVMPSAGNYWVGVSPQASSSTVGQFYVESSTSGADASTTANATFVNPSANLAPTPVSTTNRHFAYSITAAAPVPEPTTSLLLLLSSALLLRRNKTSF